MKKIKETKSHGKLKGRKILTAAGTLVVLLLLLFVFRGWIRMSVIPATVKIFYGNPARKVYDGETGKLQNPLALLGYKSIQNKQEGCETSIANGFSTQVACYYGVQAYGEISQSSLSKDDLESNAKKLQDLLLQNGWHQGGYSSDGSHMTIDKLVSSISSGIDYQPDATYAKNVGNVTCFISSTTAFSTPNPPAMSTYFSCFRTFNILGTPSFD